MSEVVANPVVAHLVDTFDGEIVAVEGRRRRDFPPRSELRAARAVYVSADLCAFTLQHDDQLRAYSEDCTQVDEYCGGIRIRRAYRRLDGAWYQWLYWRMKKAARRAADGDLDAHRWEEMRNRFNAIWQWARTNFTSDHLTTLHRVRGCDTYRAPRIWPTYGRGDRNAE